MSGSGKYNAAKLALEYIKDGTLLGIGSGTTVEVFLELLKEKIAEEDLEIYAVASSIRSKLIAEDMGIRIVDLYEYPELDICIDGADQVDSEMNCIKGGGGALTREKIIAAASKKVVIIVDESKIVRKLNHFVPVEIVPFSLGFLLKRMGEFVKAELDVELRKAVLREGSGKLGPVITDNGNYIIDCYFDSIKAEELEIALNKIPGVVENGIFPKKLISQVIVGKDDG